MSKVFDCFSFFNELDLLEIRLNILDPYVDYFVLMESSQTFSGKDKQLFYEENKDRFKKWEKKIIVINPPALEFENAFDRAFHQKESIREVLMVYANDDDIVYFGDLDEIWKPQNITDDRVYNLQQLNYCYYLNNRSSEQWVGTIVGKWKSIRKNTLSYWRATHANELPDGGYHFTNIGGADQIRKKLESYDHQEFNHEHIKADIERKMESGEDYVGRKVDWLGNPFVFHISEVDLPKYLLDNKEKYKHFFK